MKELYGFYSHQAATGPLMLESSGPGAPHYIPRAAVYSDEHGNEVVVTLVHDSESIPFYTWDDVEPRGRVVQWLRSVL